MHPTRNDLPARTRIRIEKLLNQRLADALDLEAATKQAHWNVKGPHFIGLHKLFDEFAGEVDEYTDSVAERATSLGGVAFGTVQSVSKQSKLSAYPTTIFAGRDHVDALSSAIAAVGKTVRAGIDQADELGDADTADLFTEVSRGLDKYLWFIEAHLQAEK